MPDFACPLTGSPASITWLFVIVMSDEFCTEIPGPAVLLMLKPLTLIQLLFEIVKPLAPPVTRTDAPGAVRKRIGAASVADVGTVTVSG